MAKDVIFQKKPPVKSWPIACQSQSRAHYYNGSGIEPPPYDRTKWAPLHPTAVLKSGDQYWTGKEWYLTGQAGRAVGWHEKYRRPITEQDLASQARYKSHEIDLSTYRVINLGDKLQKGDIYFDKGEWHGIPVLGAKASYYLYYRPKKDSSEPFFSRGCNNSPQSPSVDLLKYYKLTPTDIVRQGDEYFHDGSKKWCISGFVGKPAGAKNVYRREKTQVRYQIEL